MLLTDSAFLFVFLPVFFACYFPFATAATSDWWASGSRTLNKANAVLLAGGVVFLAKGAGVFVVVPLGLAALNCWISVAVHRSENARRRSLILVIVGVGSNVLALLLVRASPFLAAGRGVLSLAISRQPLLSAPVFVPIVVSIMALHAISYLVDVYRGEAEAQSSIVASAVYFLPFPFLLAGPVVRYRDVEDELTRRVAALGGFAFGVRRFVIGLCMKLLVADTLALTADAMFALPANHLTMARAWLGVACYTLQMYFALSGYSEMALGLGRMIGFRLRENFGWPLLAESVGTFWREWNVSLVAWFRDNLYDLAGGPGWRRYAAFAASCFLFGIWHGAAWTFVAWAAFHAAFLALEGFGLVALLRRVPPLLRHVYVVAVVAAGWVLFRADTLAHALLFWKAMAGFGVAATPALAVQREVTPELVAAFAAGVVGMAPLTSLLGRWRVAIDAATISAIGLLFTTALFTWRLLLNLRSFVFDIDPRK